jgi:acetolactate synthase regulatory subunit
MDKMQYRQMLPLVNEKDQMERLTAYVDDRIETMRDQLEKLADVDQVKTMQGAIRELRRFYTLRDEVIKGSE